MVIFSELNLDEEEEYQDTQDDEKQSEGLIFNLELFFFICIKCYFIKLLKNFLPEWQHSNISLYFLVFFYSLKCASLFLNF